MFAMHPATDAGQKGRNLTFECGEIACVHDIRAQPAQFAPQSGISSPCLAFGFVQSNHLDIRPLDTFAEVGEIGHANDAMTPVLRRHPVDQIDHSVLQPAVIELMDDVGNQRPRGRHGLPPHGSRHRERPGRLAETAAASDGYCSRQNRSICRTECPTSS